MAQLLHACLLLLFSVPVSLADCSWNPDPCEISCLKCVAGDYVADPADCTSYYRCTGSGKDDFYPDSFPCDSGMNFDYINHRCSSTATCTSCPVVRTCRYECLDSEDLTKISYRYDCNIYDICQNGKPVGPMTCTSPNSYFDGEKCQDDETLCCHCHPYCSLTQAQTNEFVPDPQDCRQYYICFTEGTPIDVQLCPDGEYFEEFSQRCLAGIQCARPCTNVLGEDGCIDPFTCVDQGYFAKCPDQCTPDYYHCATVTNDFVEAQSCTSGVFHPTDHTCVAEDKCP